MDQGLKARTCTKNMLAAGYVFFALLACAVTTKGEVVLPKILADHMVVQRQMPVHIWGWATAGEQVQVEFRGETKSTTANNLGLWEVYLKPGEAGGPFSLEVKGTNTIVHNDILVGDLWIASGQSNMEMPVAGFGPTLPIKDSQKEIAESKYPQIRLLRLAPTSSTFPVDEAQLTYSWAVCSPETVDNFSAVGYFFARDLQAVEKVPIGVIDSTWGGTPIESWISLQALTADPAQMPLFALYDGLMRNHAVDLRLIEKEKTEDEDAKKAGHTPIKHPGHHNILSWQPSSLFNGMIAPLTPLPIKGVIWYQGEANSDPVRAPLYIRSFTTMITDWRQAWRQPDMPFLFVQLSAIAPAAPTTWSVIREAQRRTLTLAHTAMAVTIDVGDPTNVHYPNKQPVGARLALAARAVAYGEPIEYSGPAYHYVAADDGKLTVWFEHADGLKAIDGQPIGFEVAGADHKFVVASATINRNSVTVSSPTVEHPVYVRYAWAANPQKNLVNAQGLPASPFNSDDTYSDQDGISK
jgi:sialate O-acetylesterase